MEEALNWGLYKSATKREDDMWPTSIATSNRNMLRRWTSFRWPFVRYSFNVAWDDIDWQAIAPNATWIHLS